MRPTFRFRETIGEVIGGLALTLLGVIWAVTSTSYEIAGEGGRLAPGTVPFVAGVILAVCGVVIGIKGILASRVACAEFDDEVMSEGVVEEEKVALTTPDDVETTSSVFALLQVLRKNPAISVYLIVLLGVLSMPVIGFVFAFVLAIFTILLLIERQPVVRSAVISGITGACGHLLFIVIFNLPLPQPAFL